MTTYLQGQIGAVTQVYPFQHGRGDWSAGTQLLRPCKRLYAPIRDVAALDQAYTLQFGQSGELCDRGIGQPGAAGQINISDSIARPDERIKAEISDIGAVAEMDIVEILPQPRNGQDSTIS